MPTRPRLPTLIDSKPSIDLVKELIGPRPDQGTLLGLGWECHRFSYALSRRANNEMFAENFRDNLRDLEAGLAVAPTYTVETLQFVGFVLRTCRLVVQCWNLGYSKHGRVNPPDHTGK